MTLGKLLKMLVECDYDSAMSLHQLDPYPLPPGFQQLSRWRDPSYIENTEAGAVI